MTLRWHKIKNIQWALFEVWVGTTAQVFLAWSSNVLQCFGLKSTVVGVITGQWTELITEWINLVYCNSYIAIQSYRPRWLRQADIGKTLLTSSFLSTKNQTTSYVSRKNSRVIVVTCELGTGKAGGCARPGGCWGTAVGNGICCPNTKPPIPNPPMPIILRSEVSESELFYDVTVFNGD